MRVLVVLVVLVALSGCVVMRPPRTDERPLWRITEDNRLDADCLIARAMVRKSGKQGIGMTLMLKSRGDCAVTFDTARIALTNDILLNVKPPSAQQLPGRSLIYVWWPIAFDNNRVWNAGYRKGRLQIGYTIGGQFRVWEIAMEQR